MKKDKPVLSVDVNVQIKEKEAKPTSPPDETPSVEPESAVPESAKLKKLSAAVTGGKAGEER